MSEAAVIIPHYNDTVRLARCLTALQAQCGRGIDVVVADNGSTEGLDALRASFPWVRFLDEPQKGAAHARNRGVAETSAPLLLFIDSDCLPDPDWVARARDTLERAKADLVGGRVHVFHETAPPHTGAQAFEAVFGFDNRRYVEGAGFSVTANLVTRRDVFEAAGPFIHGVSEDVEWCRRAVSKGFRLAYDDSLRVGHPSRNDWAALRRKWRRLTDETFALQGRSPARRLSWAGRALLMPASILAHAPRVLRHPTLNGPGERMRALATLFRLRMVRMVWMLGQAIQGR